MQLKYRQKLVLITNKTRIRNVFGWLTNSVRVYCGEKQHVLVESDRQIDENGFAYHQYGIENGLEFFVYRYPGMSANNGKKLPLFDYHQIQIHNPHS